MEWYESEVPMVKRSNTNKGAIISDMTTVTSQSKTSDPINNEFLQAIVQELNKGAVFAFANKVDKVYEQALLTLLTGQKQLPFSSKMKRSQSSIMNLQKSSR